MQCDAKNFLHAFLETANGRRDVAFGLDAKRRLSVTALRKPDEFTISCA